MSRIRAFLRHQRGNATIEFAFASLFLFGVMMVALDFGIYAQQNLKLASGVQQGAVYAFNNRNATVDTITIGQYVTAAAGVAPTMTYQCNGSNCSGAISTSGTAQCIGAPDSSGWPTFTAASGTGSNATCADGSVPGVYLVIRASRTYQAVTVPDKYLSGRTMKQQAVVRLS